MTLVRAQTVRMPLSASKQAFVSTEKMDAAEVAKERARHMPVSEERD